MIDADFNNGELVSLIKTTEEKSIKGGQLRTRFWKDITMASVMGGTAAQRRASWDNLKNHSISWWRGGALKNLFNINCFPQSTRLQHPYQKQTQILYVQVKEFYLQNRLSREVCKTRFSSSTKSQRCSLLQAFWGSDSFHHQTNVCSRVWRIQYSSKSLSCCDAMRTLWWSFAMLFGEYSAQCRHVRWSFRNVEEVLYDTSTHGHQHYIVKYT